MVTKPTKSGVPEADPGANPQSASDEPATQSGDQGEAEGPETVQYIYTVNKSTTQVMKMEEIDPKTGERKELTMQGYYGSGYGPYEAGSGYESGGYGAGQGYEGYTGYEQYGAGYGGGYDPYAGYGGYGTTADPYAAQNLAAAAPIPPCGPCGPCRPPCLPPCNPAPCRPPCRPPCLPPCNPPCRPVPCRPPCRPPCLPCRPCIVEQ